jgi:hypothetical protein
MTNLLWGQCIWLCALALGSFLVSWLFSDLLRLPRTAYVAIFAIGTGAFLYGYVQWSNLNTATFISYQWPQGLIVAVVSGLAVVALVPWLVRWQSLALLPPPGPRGRQLISILLVDGVVNGAAEAMLISVLPVLIVWQALTPFPWFQQWPGSTLASIIAFAVSLIIVTLHHLGFRELRCHLIIFVIGGNAVFTLAYLLTVNPLAAVVAHVMMHIGCELQSIEVPLRQTKRPLEGAGWLHSEA